MKFGRTYQMMVTGRSGQPIFIKYPLTLEFSVTHNFFSAANVADFSIYNLSANNRSDILFDAYTKAQAYPITLNAGYVSQQPQGPITPAVGSPLGSPGASAVLSSLPQIFNGFVNVAFTERNGSELITRINALDSGDLTGSEPSAYFPSGFSIKAGTDFTSMVRAIMGLLRTNNVRTGAVVATPTPAAVAKDRQFTGRVWDALQSLTPPGGHTFIENGVCNMLGQNDVIPGTNNLGVLTSSTGLLNIPKYLGTTVECSCIFEPALAIGKTITLASDFNSVVNKLYKIIAYSHHGVISGAVSGDAISDITLMALPSPVAPAS